MSDEHDDASEFASRANEILNEHIRSRREFEDRPIDLLDPNESFTRLGALTQYARFDSGYKPMSSTVPTLPAGCYDIEASNQGVYVVPAIPPSGLLLKLPEMRSDEVIKKVERFWASEKDYKEGNEFVVGGASYKAGIMLYGAAGTGKSCTIKIVSKMLVERGGVVFFGSGHPIVLSTFLGNFSRIEPHRKCIVILEDIDSLIHNYGESNYLELLDSAKTIDNVMFIATTNYPEKLDPRIYNRPGRFSHVIKIGYPTPAAREAYLKAVLKNHRDVAQIVAASENFTIDHLSACVNSVYREGKDLTDELKRLRILFKVPYGEEPKRVGFGE